MSEKPLAMVAEAFEQFDLAMDPVLDMVQDRAITGAICAGLAVRLVAYATQAQGEQAEAIAVSLNRELASLKRQMRAS